MSTIFINGKQAVIIGLRRLRNSPSYLVIFLVVAFKKIPLFSKDLITLIMPFILLFVRVIPTPLLEVNFLLSSFIALLT